MLLSIASDSTYNGLNAASIQIYLLEGDEDSQSCQQLLDTCYLPKTVPNVAKQVDMLHNTYHRTYGPGYNYGTYLLKSGCNLVMQLSKTRAFLPFLLDENGIGVKKVNTTALLLNIITDFVDESTNGVFGGGKEDDISPSYCVRALLNLSFPPDDSKLQVPEYLSQIFPSHINITEVMEKYIRNPLITKTKWRQARADALLLISRTRQAFAVKKDLTEEERDEIQECIDWTNGHVVVLLQNSSKNDKRIQYDGRCHTSLEWEEEAKMEHKNLSRFINQVKLDGCLL